VFVVGLDLVGMLNRHLSAAASSGTYGFNAGIEFDIDALERQLQAQQTQSISSNLVANNININIGLIVFFVCL
jgi:hypothetical protein